MSFPGDPEDANLAWDLAAQVDARAEAVAIVDQGRGRQTTFAQLETASQVAAHLLTQLGLRPGGRVLLLVPMSAELYALLLGIFRSRLTAVIVDPGGGIDYLSRCCQIAQPTALVGIGRAHLLRLVSPQLRQIPHQIGVGRWPVPMTQGRFHLGQALRQASPSQCIPPSACGPDEPALLTFTSGTTGQPKAALRTHGFLRKQGEALADALTLQPGSTDLTTLPIVLLANLAQGVTSVIPDTDLRCPARINTLAVRRQMATARPQSTAASPAFLDRLLPPVPAGRSDRQVWGNLERIFVGGAPVFPPLMDRLQQAAPQAAIVPVYGSTEAEPIAHFRWSEVSTADRNAMKGGGGLLAGRPVHQIQVRIIRNQPEKPVELLDLQTLDSWTQPPGEPGEIIVSGDHVLPGYLGGLGDEETKIRVGQQIWHRTGDCGYLDHQGRLWLLGRCSALIRDRRGILYPLAVEAAAADHPLVARCAVVSHQGQRWLVVQPVSAKGLAIKDPQAQGFFEKQLPTDDLHKQTLLQDIQGMLGWAHLDRVLLWQQIPVDHRHNAKIDYQAVRKRLSRTGTCFTH